MITIIITNKNVLTFISKDRNHWQGTNEQPVVVVRREMNRFVKELSMSLVMISSAIGTEKWQLSNDLNNSNSLQVGKANFYVTCDLVYELHSFYVCTPVVGFRYTENSAFQLCMRTKPNGLKSEERIKFLLASLGYLICIWKAKKIQTQCLSVNTEREKHEELVIIAIIIRVFQ